MARCDTENDATLIAKLLNEHFNKNEKPEPVKAACTCQGLYEECSNCPPQRKSAPSGITFGHYQDEVKTLEGRVLTILDASIPGEQQNKALKGLVKREIRQTINHMRDFCFRGLEPPLSEPEVEG